VITTLTGKTTLGFIKGPGHDENHAIVQTYGEGDIEAPRHHVTVIRPKGRGNKAVAAKGEHLGKLGLIDSIAVKHKGKWKVIEHPTKEAFLVHPLDLAGVVGFSE